MQEQDGNQPNRNASAAEQHGNRAPDSVVPLRTLLPSTTPSHAEHTASAGEHSRATKPASNTRRPTKPWISFLRGTWRTLVIGGALAFGTGVAACGALVYLIYQQAQQLPSYDHLTSYDPAVMTRVYSNDGQLIAEYAREQRLFVPIEAIPARVQEAFIAVEDHRFFSHRGIDPVGIMRAVVTNLRNYGSGKRLVGASTITQQVAKNFLLSSEVSFQRKMREAVLAYRLEQSLSKQEILELYLNGIYLGAGTYGVGAAALTYFEKSLLDLTTAEAAFLAALPRSPSNYNPVRYPDRALERRNWVLQRMLVEEFISEQEYDNATAQDLVVTMRPFGIRHQSDAYFAEEVRRRLAARYGLNQLYEGGLAVRSTIDTELQRLARNVLRDGIARYEQSKGYRGALANYTTQNEVYQALQETAIPDDLSPWRLAAVTDVRPDGARIAVRIDEQRNADGIARIDRGWIPREALSWAVVPDPDWVAQRVAALERAAIEQAIAEGQNPEDRFFRPPPRPILPEETASITPEEALPSDVLKVGDIIIVRPDVDQTYQSGTTTEQWILAQMPRLQGAIMAMDPHTGRVRAMVGGFSFDASSFNRAVQAQRQPGSSFKPFVYLAALTNDMTPSTVLSDSPLLVDQGEQWGYWRPKNFSGQFLGTGTLRLGVEKSRNVMTVRLTQLIGTSKILETARNFGIGEDWSNISSIALGAGETTLASLVQAYGMLANGGKQITANFIDQVQNKHGETIFRADTRACTDCIAAYHDNAVLPVLADNRTSVVDAASAYQITSMLEGVVQKGTGTALKSLGIPVAGKTGTTNEEKDSWFIGFTPNLVVGVYFGYDRPAPMGRNATGGGLAAPVVRDFLAEALKGQPGIPFRVPDDIQFFRIRADDGTLAEPQDTNVILEAFKSGESPPEGAGVELVSYESAPSASADHPAYSPGILPASRDSNPDVQLSQGGLF